MRAREILTAIILITLSSCATFEPKSDKQESDPVAVRYTPGTRCMPRYVVDPATVNNKSDMRKAMVDHYWDNFNFDADSLVVEYDTIDICQAMADYVTLIEPERADSLMRSLMRRAESSRPVLDFFATITEMVLHDPNSPLRHDEYYIPVLETLVNSPLLDEYDKLIPAYDLEIALKNRIGHTATDFEYTLSNGRKGRMHDIEAEYLIVMFTNPGCPMCREITEQIIGSPMLNELSEMGLLKIISVYPDADIEAWRNYLTEMPANWINSYDKDMVISEQRLYNLNAIPALYLLDSNKRVLVKDGSDVAFIEHTISLNDTKR